MVENILAAYLLVWTVVGFIIVFKSGALHGTKQLLVIQEAQWYRTVGVVNSFVVFALCLLILLG